MDVKHKIESKGVDGEAETEFAVTGAGGRTSGRRCVRTFEATLSSVDVVHSGDGVHESLHRQCRQIPIQTKSLPGLALTSRRDDTAPGWGDTIEILSQKSNDGEPLPWLCRARYEVLGALGQGGMGTVWRVFDRRLGRELALKAIKSELLGRESVMSRFVEEAQATSQLQHPGIVPVYDLEQTPDGHCYFTMKIVQGETLSRCIHALHESSAGRDSWSTPASGWGFRRLLEAFQRVCEAVSYAHQRGVLHRDLKPDNMMLGEHGEVLVLDWGLVKVSGVVETTRVSSLASFDMAREFPESLGNIEDSDGFVVTERALSKAHETISGTIHGTPAYMSPEQALGISDALGPHCDIYSLGAILYELLSGRPPFVGNDLRSILLNVLQGEIPPPGRPDDSLVLGTRWDGAWEEDARCIPGELLQICDRAMALKSSERFADAMELGDAIRSWLEGRRQREEALALVASAKKLLPESASLRIRAEELRKDADNWLQRIGSWEGEERKAAAWDMQDRAVALAREAKRKELDYERLLHAALTRVPTLTEAHAALASFHLDAYQQAENTRDDAGMLVAEQRLQAAVSALPLGHPMQARVTAYLDGQGQLTLRTEPTGACVRIFRYEERYRRLHPVLHKEPGTTPILSLPLRMGSYLLELRHPGCEVVYYPVSIGRQEHWDGSLPEGVWGDESVWLPPIGSFGSDDCYIPAGWFWAGGDPDAMAACERRRLWLDGFVMRRYPVTNREFIAFLDDLVAQGREDDAIRSAPCERPGTLGELGQVIYGRDEAGRFVLRPDADGDLWGLDEPVIMVNWFAISMYTQWYAEKTGLPWRQCSEWEYEKAARGVDGRLFPWGHFADDSWACCSGSHADEWDTANVYRDFPVDCSPYGVRGLAGNVREWCGELWPADGKEPPIHGAYVPPPETPPLVLLAKQALCVRGGSWSTKLELFGRSASRNRDVSGGRDGGLGFRLCRTIER